MLKNMSSVRSTVDSYEIEKLTKGFKIGFWAEETAAKDIDLGKLPSNTSKLFVAVKKGGEEDLRRLLEVSGSYGIDIGLWPLLPREGYYVSPWNLGRVKKFLGEVLDRYEQPDWIALDIENYANRAGSIFPTRYLSKTNRAVSNIVLETIVDMVHENGRSVMSTYFPLPKTLNSIFGIADVPRNTDGFNAMLYTSVLRKFVPGELVDRGVGNYVRDRCKSPKFSVSLGLIHEGVNSRTLTKNLLYNAEGLKRDLDILKRHGIAETLLYSADPLFRN
jgi:hypothetical protein